MRSWEVPRYHPRGPAMLLPGARHRTPRSTATEAPPAPPAHAPEPRAQLVTERCPGARPRRRRRPGRGTGEAPAPPIRNRPGSRGPVPARRGRFPRPGGKMRRREREREGSGPCQKRRGPDGPGWRGRDSPVPMAPPPQARVRKGGASRASAYGTRGRSWQGRVPPRPRRQGTGHRAPAREARPPPQRGGSGQRGSVRRGRQIGASRHRHEHRGATRLTGLVASHAQAVAASPFRRYERPSRHRPVPAAAPPRALHRPRQQWGIARDSREQPQLRGDRVRLGPSPARATRGPSPGENGKAPVPPAVPGKCQGRAAGAERGLLCPGVLPAQALPLSLCPAARIRSYLLRPRSGPGGGNDGHCLALPSEPPARGAAAGTELHCKKRQALQNRDTFIKKTAMTSALTSHKYLHPEL